MGVPCLDPAEERPIDARELRDVGPRGTRVQTVPSEFISDRSLEPPKAGADRSVDAPAPGAGAHLSMEPETDRPMLVAGSTWAYQSATESRSLDWASLRRLVVRPKHSQGPEHAVSSSWI